MRKHKAGLDMEALRPEAGISARTIGLGLGMLLVSAVAIAGPWEGGKNHPVSPSSHVERRGGDSLGRAGHTDFDLDNVSTQTERRGGDSLGRAGHTDFDLDNVFTQTERRGGDSLGRFGNADFILDNVSTQTERRGGDSLGRAGHADFILDNILTQTERRGGDSLGRAGHADFILDNILTQTERRGGDSLGRFGNADFILDNVLTQTDRRGGDSLGRIAGPQPVASATVSVHAFPNPTQGAIDIQINCPTGQESAYTLQLIDLAGKQVDVARFAFTQIAGTIQMDMSQLPAGVYWVVLQSQTQRLSTRIVRQ